MVSAVHGLTSPGGPAAVDRDGNRHLIDAARAAGADVVLLSVLGASADSPMGLLRMKYAAEQHLAASGVPSTVVAAHGLPGAVDRPARPARPDAAADQSCWAEAVRWSISCPSSTSPPSSTRWSPTRPPGAAPCRSPARTTSPWSTSPRPCSRQPDGPPPRTIPPTALRLTAATVGRAVPTLGRVLRTSLAMDAADHPAQLNDVRHQYPGVPCTSLTQVLGATPLSP